MLIDNNLFYITNKDTYPPFKNGFYMEEYFFDYMKKNNLTKDKNGRIYIPALWTNFQIEHWFDDRKSKMQSSLDNFIENNPSENGYFTVVQYDDGPKLQLPEDTVVYGACSGTIPLPLIYEDRENCMIKDKIIKKFNEKTILCSFVGTNTHTVRTIIQEKYINNQNFDFCLRGAWSPIVEKNHQNIFIEKTIDSKFALAARGYGRSSFRFFEIFKLGSIPIYIWDDIEWLPYKDIIDYSKICISLNINKINNLENILLSIDEEKYNEMLENYNQIKEKFELEFMCKYITI